MLDAIWLEVRQSLRSLRRSPGFACVFVITIGLASAATITTVSVLDGIVFRSVAAPDPDRLAAIAVTDNRTNQPGFVYSDTFEGYRDTQQSFATIAMYFGRYFRVEAGADMVDAVTEGVTPEYFEVLSTKTAQGRLFSDLDTAAVPVVVLSDRFRRQLFGDDSTVVGTTIRVDGQPVTVIGVTAPGFEGVQLDGGTDMFMPLTLLHTFSGTKTPLRAMNIIGRLAPGVEVSEARAELLTKWPVTVDGRMPSSLSPAEQESLRSQKVDVQPVASGFSPLRDRYGRSIVVLVGLSVALLAIACINLTGLLLARSLNQRHQLALKLAVGATRARALSHILLEGVLLTLAGFLIAVPLTWWTTRELEATFAFGRSTPLLLSVTPNGSLLATGALVAALVGITIGILPAWRVSRGGRPTDLHATRSVGGTLGRSGRFLLVMQVALSLILLVSAGLFANTLTKLRANQASVKAENVLFTRISRVPGDREPINAAYLRTLLGELAGVGGVQSTALSVYFPALLRSGSVPTGRYATAGSGSAELSALTEFVSPGFFDTFGIPILKGRDFTWADDIESLPVALVSQSVANVLFPGSEAVGGRLQMPSGTAVKEFVVVGVVADAAFGTIREPRQHTVFRPILQDAAMMSVPMVHARFEGDLEMVSEGYKRAVASQGRHFVNVLLWLPAFTDSALLNERLMAWLSTFVSILVVILACLGTYSMLAYAVTSRLRELGVRSALGATQTNIMRLIVRDGLAVAVPGVALGVVGALAAAGLVRSNLYGIEPHDPGTIVAASIALTLAVAFASVIPALRASRIDPIEALRHD